MGWRDWSSCTLWHVSCASNYKTRFADSKTDSLCKLTIHCSLRSVLTFHRMQGYMMVLAVERILPAASKRRIPPTILPSLMLLFWPLELILFRSAYISSNALHNDPDFILETLLAGTYSLWLVIYINIGYRTRLDGVLKGMKAGRGNAAGTKSIIGKGTADEEEYVVRDNPAEPRCMSTSENLHSHLTPAQFSHHVSSSLLSHHSDCATSLLQSFPNEGYARYPRRRYPRC